MREETGGEGEREEVREETGGEGGAELGLEVREETGGEGGAELGQEVREEVRAREMRGGGYESWISRVECSAYLCHLI